MADAPILVESVEAYLELQCRGRPQTIDEIYHHVSKSPRNCRVELRKLVLFGRVKIIVLRFNNSECSFYTVRDDVIVTVVKQGTRY